MLVIEIIDCEAFWAGYWRGLVGNSTVKVDEQYLATMDRFIDFNYGWDEGIEDRCKLNQLMNK